KKEQIIVGVNRYQDEDAKVNLSQLKVDPEIEQEQRAHLAIVRQQRDSTRVAECLSLIDGAARAPSMPLMPLFIEAVKADCTLGEICSVLRDRWGEYNARILI
ncbi:MAG: methylmalonyl-CoA mutase family protein, partial [Anaerolineae bacterium]|nr:methylmalonyl-CoA mutase family protein [Anaerolineae bacterium]